MNMQAITVYLKKLSEQNPSASYYNVDVLKYQVNTFFPLELVKDVCRFDIYTEIKNSCSLAASMQTNCHPSSRQILGVSVFTTHRLCPGLVHSCYASCHFLEFITCFSLLTLQFMCASFKYCFFRYLLVKPNFSWIQRFVEFREFVWVGSCTFFDFVIA